MKNLLLLMVFIMTCWLTSCNSTCCESELSIENIANLSALLSDQGIIISHVKYGTNTLKKVKVESTTRLGSTYSGEYNGNAFNLPISDPSILKFTSTDPDHDVVTIKIKNGLDMKSIGVEMFKKTDIIENKRRISGTVANRKGVIDQLQIKINNIIVPSGVDGRYTIDLDVSTTPPSMDITIEFLSKIFTETPIGVIILQNAGTPGKTVIDVAFDDDIKGMGNGE